MSAKTGIFFSLCLLVLLGACHRQLKPSELPSSVQLGQVYYAQFSFFQEENNYRTTNYRKGILIPINTPVSLVSIDTKSAQVKLRDGGQPLNIENVQKYTKDDMPAAFLKIFGPRPVNLEDFSEDERDGILAGKVKKGMDRRAVLAAIGYPPQHETPSLNGNDWTYWSNRWNKFVVHFKNNKVENIAD